MRDAVDVLIVGAGPVGLSLAIELGSRGIACQGWKLGAVLEGWGGDGLLGTYEEERRPVHEWAVSEAIANYAMVGNQFARPGLEEAGWLGDATRREVSETILTQKLRELRSLGVVKGYLALIRPDQHVAWRGDGAPADLGALIDTVRGCTATPPGASAPWTADKSASAPPSQARGLTSSEARG